MSKRKAHYAAYIMGPSGYTFGLAIIPFSLGRNNSWTRAELKVTDNDGQLVGSGTFNAKEDHYGEPLSGDNPSAWLTAPSRQALQEFFEMQFHPESIPDSACANGVALIISEGNGERRLNVVPNHEGKYGLPTLFIEEDALSKVWATPGDKSDQYRKLCLETVGTCLHWDYALDADEYLGAEHVGDYYDPDALRFLHLYRCKEGVEAALVKKVSALVDLVEPEYRKIDLKKKLTDFVTNLLEAKGIGPINSLSQEEMTAAIERNVIDTTTIGIFRNFPEAFDFEGTANAG